MSVKASRPITTQDLSPIERVFLDAMHHLGYGRLEMLGIAHGELVLEPWPKTIRQVRFGISDPGRPEELKTDFRLKAQVSDLFEYIRSIDVGEIRSLEIRAGLPFAMQIVQAPTEPKGAQ